MSKLYLSCLTIVSSLLLSFSLSAQIDFTEHTIALGGQNFPGGGESADFDGDGLLDILVYNSGGHSTANPQVNTSHIAWYENLGNGDYKKHPISVTHVNNAVSEDFDQDGDIDILYSYYYSGSGDPRGNQSGVGILINDGSGVFTRQTIDGETSSEIYENIELIDINADGYMDFLFGYEVEDWDLEQVGPNEYEAELTGEVSFRVYAYINKGNGDFKINSIGGERVYRGGADINITPGDLNGDGNTDFAVVTYNSNDDENDLYVRIFDPSDSTFSFTRIEREDLLTGGTPKLFDYDADGDLDILQYFVKPGERALFENDGAGNFTKVIIPEFIDVPTVYNYQELDFDGDGDLDQIRTQYSWHENTGSDYVEQVIDSALIGLTFLMQMQTVIWIFWW